MCTGPSQARRRRLRRNLKSGIKVQTGMVLFRPDSIVSRTSRCQLGKSEVLPEVLPTV